LPFSISPSISLKIGLPGSLAVLLAVRRAETLGGSIGKILWILLKESSDIVQQTPPFRISQGFRLPRPSARGGIGNQIERKFERKNQFSVLLATTPQVKENFSN
jgi:hypothetical protein